MNTYTFTEARQKLASLLEQAARNGEVRIKRRDGQVFVIRPQKRQGSPLNIEGIELNLSRDEILESIAESRRSG
ncbi:MAG: type II toxin-antitoxin system Phd/YefM family antitoxin [Chloroflexota bacterium]